MKPEPEDVAEKLRSACQELSRRLRAGQDVLAEEFLCSEVMDDEQREDVLELLYTEFVVRQEIGQQPDPAEWYRRFPQWESDLAELFEVHHYVCEQEQEQSRAAEMSSTVVGNVTVPNAFSGEATRQRFIRGYELLDEIGRGGMGVVYKARQLSVNRVVALKMIGTRGSIGGVEDTRFRLEAEAAASLHHPHIAQVYEAGEQDGQPYLVMEYVAGPSLESALAKAPLTARSAAELLVPLAEAIEYAHQHGIIHRDLKPSNIMLTPEGQPKITDFGLARRCDDTRQARVTETGVVLGTPAYMPPEQAKGDHAIVGPTSDVYGLGAILYESVTGRPPFVADSLPEILKQIQLMAPIRPRRLNAHFPKDLETICLKCLEKQPAARYDSAMTLAEDLRRFLNGQSIHARPARWWERCHKWSRRRPAIAALLAAIVLVTSLGVTGVTWQTRQALLEARVSQEMKKFFGKILESIDPAAARGRSITVREMLDEASTQLAAADIHRRIQAEVHDSLGITYARIGEPEAAEKHLRSAWQLYQVERGPGDAETLKMMSNLASVLKQLDRLPEAEALARQGLEMARRSLGEKHRVYQTLLTNLAVIVDDRGRKQEAENLFRQQLDHYIQSRGPQHRDTLFAMANLGAWLMNNGRYQEAEQLIDPCWKRQCELLGKDHPETLVSMQNLVSVLTNLGRSSEALPLDEQLLELSRRVHGPTALLTLRREENLAKLLFALQRREDAMKLGQHAYDELRKRLGTTHARVLAATETLVMLLGLNGRMEDAESIALQAYTEVSTQLGAQHSSAARMARLLANLYESWDRPAEQQRWQGIADRAAESGGEET